MISALLAAIGLVVLFASLPLVVELALLSLAAALPTGKVGHVASSLRLFVIVPAHNEEKLIASCVDSLLAYSSAQVEVWVIAHNCTDATQAKAEAAGARVLVLNGEGGKGAALRHGFAHALASGADGVLVVDADSVVSPTLTATVISRLASGFAALQCRYQAANTGANTRTRLMGLALLGMNVVRPRGRERLGLSCGIFGNGFALSRQTLESVPYAADSVVEDLEYHLQLLQSGIRVRFVDDATVFGEMPEGKQGATSQRARWEGGRALMRRVWTRPLAGMVMHGQLRMVEPLLDLLALPLATEVLLLLVAVAIPVPWVRSYGLAGVGAVLVYLVVSACVSDAPVRTLLALASAPGYLIWKILMIPATRRAAARDATWVRTQRNAEADEKQQR